MGMVMVMSLVMAMVMVTAITIAICFVTHKRLAEILQSRLMGLL